MFDEISTVTTVTITPNRKTKQELTLQENVQRAQHKKYLTEEFLAHSGPFFPSLINLSLTLMGD